MIKDVFVVQGEIYDVYLKTWQFYRAHFNPRLVSNHLSK